MPFYVYSFMNKVMLIGNVGCEPDIRYYDVDQCVATITLATTERGYTLPNGTVVPDHIDWHKVVMFRELAKYADKYIHKGDKLYVEGRIRYRYEDDKLGKRKFITEIYCNNLEWLSSPRRVETKSEAKNESEPSDNTKLPF